MNTDFKTSFLHNVQKIRSEPLLEKISEAIFNVENASCLQDIPRIKKMKGDKNGISYRTRVGDYRIGVTVDNDLITFVVCKHRKDIYKYFP